MPVHIRLDRVAARVAESKTGKATSVHTRKKYRKTNKQRPAPISELQGKPINRCILSFNTMPSFKYRSSASPATAEAVRNVEAQLGISLPRDYVEFISFQNGGSVDFENKYSYAVPDEYPDPPLCLESFFPVEQLPVECHLVQDAFDVKFLPIGIDNFGNYICFGLAPHQVGKIFS